MVYLTEKCSHFRIQLSEVTHEPSRVKRAAHHDLNPIVVPMQVSAPVTFWHQRKMVRCLETIGPSDFCLLDNASRAALRVGRVQLV